MDNNMIIGFDIGNTNTTLGLYNKEMAPFKTYRYRTERGITSDELGLMVTGFVRNTGYEPEKIKGLALSSVVNEVIEGYKNMSRSFFSCEMYEIDHQSRLSFKINYNNPSELGPDRIVNAEAALREHGGGCIIIDIGTAATFCVLLKDGTFDGGLIAPGIGITINALASNTSRLPRIIFGKPDRLIARDTVNAIKSGFFYGWLSLVEGIIERIKKEYNENFKIIITGGYGSLISGNIPHPCINDPLLTMKGIKYIYDMNI